MQQLISRFLIYRSIEKDSILHQLAAIAAKVEQGSYDRLDMIDRLHHQVHRLLDLATRYGFDGNLWQNYLAYLIATTECPFSLACEQTGHREGSVNRLALNDFRQFKKLFHYDFSRLEDALKTDTFRTLQNYVALSKRRSVYNASVSEKVRDLSQSIASAPNASDVLHVVTTFYKDHGVGMLGLNHAFRCLRQGQLLLLQPISNPVQTSLADIIGYENQKKKLVKNTEAFLRGAKANNLLLYGDSGTGKSTCVKAILSAYADQGLRMIEVYRHQFKDLSDVMAQIKQRNYRFILFMDDLSFEDFETDYKYLKAIIEGGLESTPDNILIYATSNRRHLIRETWTDRQETENDLFPSDSAEEKMALVHRFGLTLHFPRPDQKQYLNIVRGIASRHPQIDLSEEELLEKARQWGLWHGSVSGRRAQQLINDLCGQLGKDT